jgi:hypothetical protein
MPPSHAAGCRRIMDARVIEVFEERVLRRDERKL